VPCFLIEKNTKYIFRAGSEKNWVMGIFAQKEICHQTLGHINRTVNLFELHQYIICLLRKMQNTFQASSEKKLGDGNLFPKRKFVAKT